MAIVAACRTPFFEWWDAGLRFTLLIILLLPLSNKTS